MADQENHHQEPDAVVDAPVAEMAATVEEAGVGDDAGPSAEPSHEQPQSLEPEGGPASMTGVGPPSPLTGCYLLIVIGEPHTSEHKDIILQRLVKGKSSPSSFQCDIMIIKKYCTLTL